VFLYRYEPLVLKIHFAVFQGVDLFVQNPKCLLKQRNRLCGGREVLPRALSLPSSPFAFFAMPFLDVGSPAYPADRKPILCKLLIECCW
jgi:hypothetical protein